MTNFYKRITGSEIQGDASTAVQPAGTLTIDSNNNTLKLHDGSTPGGNDIGGGGGGLTNGWTITPLAMSSQFANVTSIQSGDDSVFSSSNGNGYVAVVANENVYVQTNATAGVDGYTWTYGADGTFNLPLAVNGKGVIQTTSDYSFVASEAIYNLGADGTLTIPGTIATTAGTGAVVLNSNDGTHTHTLTLGTDGSLTIPNIIRSTAGQYYAAVSDTSTEMSSQFTWAPSSRVYAGMGSDNNLGVWFSTTTTDSGNNGVDHTWTFGFDGYTTFPSNTLHTNNNLTLKTSGIPTSVANWNGLGGWNQGAYTNLTTTGGSGTGLTVDVAANGGGYIDISAITINTPGVGYRDGDVITINNENNIPGTFTVSIQPAKSWTFGANGTTLLPGAISGDVPQVGRQLSTGEPNFGYGGIRACFSGNEFTGGSFGDIQVGWIVGGPNGFTDIVAALNDVGGGFITLTNQSWPGQGPYTFSSPDYVAASSHNIDITTAGGTWSFGQNSVFVPSGGNIVANTSLNIYSNNNSGIDISSGNADVYVDNGTVSIITNNQNGQAKSWTWDDSGTITFPQGGTLKVGPIPAHSTGAVGDKAGTVAFGNGYLYYCILDHDNNSPVSYDSNVGENTGQIGYTRLKVMTSGNHPDLTNWTVTGPGITGTVKVTGPSYAEQYGETWFPVDTDFYQSAGTYTFTPPGNIWRRVAWSGDTW